MIRAINHDVAGWGRLAACGGLLARLVAQEEAGGAPAAGRAGLPHKPGGINVTDFGDGTLVDSDHGYEVIVLIGRRKRD